MLDRAIDKIVPALLGHSFGARIALGLLAFAAAGMSIAVAPGREGILGAGLGLLMLVIAAVDARRFIIPNELVLATLALGYIAAVVATDTILRDLAAATLRGAVLGLLFLTLRAAYGRLRGREGLGLGDVKLATAAGVWLDWPAMPIAIEIAALAALALYLVGHFSGRRPMRASTRLPFGLFFAPAIWIAWLLQAWVYA